jgi:hypothetical protein
MVTINGTSISEATIDGESVQEITVDGDVVWTAKPDSVVFSFESGNLDNWTNKNAPWSTTTNKAYDGSYSAASGNTNSSAYSYGQRSFEYDISSVEVRLRETSSSNGMGVQLLNSNGARVAGGGLENPQWAYTDGDANSGKTLYSGDGYNRWIHLTFDFDYPNNNVTYTFNDPASGTTKSTTAGIDSSGPVTQVQVVNVQAASQLWDQTQPNNANIDNWTDYIVGYTQ